MKTTIYLITICFMALMALPAIVPVESKGNSAFADVVFGDCPGCWIWVDQETGDVCVIACKPYSENGGYYLWAQAERLTGGYHHWSCQWIETWEPQEEWTHMLLILSGLNRCQCDPEPNGLCCHEYTARMPMPDGWEEWTGEWQITDGDVFGENIVCEHVNGQFTGKPA